MTASQLSPIQVSAIQLRRRILTLINILSINLASQKSSHQSRSMILYRRPREISRHEIPARQPSPTQPNP